MTKTFELRERERKRAREERGEEKGGREGEITINISLSSPILT
jgi:hypothetical protein